MNFPQTERTTLKRLPKRGVFDRELVYGILDEGFVCHVGFAVDGLPVVIPTGYARVDDHLYIHGSQVSRMLRTLAQRIDVCVTITLVDGLVLARSAFHHSVNYRSVVIFGRASMVEEREAKLAALRAFSEHVIPGRWDDVRQPTEQELKATTVLSLPLIEVSAKMRTGPPLDDEEDYALNVWAGVIPLHLVAGEPINDPRLPEGIEPPRYALEYKRGSKRES
jgi:nitroimidazol reductase NimA-like FMN-containing flavoprotein (pyridoxamine 5'-phosphate oxidase superfamily)